SLVDKKLTSEEAMPRIFGDHLDGDGTLWIRPGTGVQDKYVVLIQIRFNPLTEGVESFLRNGLIHSSPVHHVFCRRITHNEFIFRGTSGALPGISYQRAIAGKFTFTPQDCFLH